MSKTPLEEPTRALMMHKYNKNCRITHKNMGAREIHLGQPKVVNHQDLSQSLNTRKMVIQL